MVPTLRAEQKRQATPWAKAAQRVMASLGGAEWHAGWVHWVGGNGGSHVVTDTAGAELVPAEQRVTTLATALLATAPLVAIPPGVEPVEPEPPAAPTQPPAARLRRAASAPGRPTPIVPRRRGVVRARVDVKFNPEERDYLQARADAETGGNLSELVRRLALSDRAAWEGKSSGGMDKGSPGG